MGVTSTGATPCRILIVQDKQANGVAPAVTDVLLTNEAASPNNLSNSRRFKTLLDYTDKTGIGTAGPQVLYVNEYKKLDIPVEFNNGVAGTIADITTNSIYAIVFCGNVGVANVATNIIARVRFTDN